MARTKNAIVLLSGGLDSATCLAIANQQNYRTHALSFRYGQRHTVELDAAEQVAKTLAAAEHRIVDIDLGVFGGSALTDHRIDVPTGNPDAAGIPSTYVPARNTIFLAYAVAWAEVIGARDVFIGVNAVDYSGYPDCRPEYVKAFEAMANLATKAGVEGRRLRIRAPLIQRSKADIIRLGLQLEVPYHLTHSCYAPDGEGRACGACDSCVIRARGFAANGTADPALAVAR